jgi:hypothetical protein
MKRLIFLIVVAFVAWYGWNHRQDLFQRKTTHEAVIENHSGSDVTRIRLKVDGQTLVKEALADGETARLPFRVNRDSGFDLVWTVRGGDQSWSGGMVPAGPMAQRHTFTIGEGNEVTYRAENR